MDDVRKRRTMVVLGKIIIILLFVFIAVFAAKVHEPWSDEAQSFLIARDNTFFEIFDQAKFEGTTPTWFLIIKVFIILGGSYGMFFLLPLLFSVIGLVIFEFKVKAPWYIKILLPFTYFILFQYTIVARSYCMVFPALMWIVSIYENREKKKISYFLAMIFLMSICSYTLLIAGAIWSIDVLRLIRKKEVDKKKIILLAVIFIALITTFIIIFPSPDCNFVPYNPSDLPSIIYHATIGSQRISVISSVLITIGFFSLIALAIFKEKKERAIKAVELVILFLPVLMEHMFLKSEMWHIGIITILIFSAFMMNGMINRNVIIKIMIVVICLVQIVWSGISINYDTHNNYSASSDVADFLKQNKYENLIGIGFDVVAIQPYFDHNIFKNQHTEKSFWLFKRDSGYVQDKTLLDDKDAVFVIADFNRYEFREICDALEEEGYERYHFAGAMITKTFLHELKGYYVYVKTEDNVNGY